MISNMEKLFAAKHRSREGECAVAGNALSMNGIIGEMSELITRTDSRRIFKLGEEVKRIAQNV